MDCLFCKISKGEIPSQKVFENSNVIGFKDINPMAKIHLLFIHKDHTDNAMDLVCEKPTQLLELFQGINSWFEQDNIASSGIRIITNVKESAGQSVFHTHFHVLGGERLSWP